ncbi:Pentatricopeptide repeat-containing protein At2g13600 [Linum perenne]
MSLRSSLRPPQLSPNNNAYGSHPLPTQKHPSLSVTNSSSYASTLDSCSSSSTGKQIHGHIVKSGFEGHKFVTNKLLQMYGRCGCLEDAAQLFDEMPQRDLYAWTAIISVHLDQGLFDDSISLFQELLLEAIDLQFFVFPLIFKVCSGLGMVALGWQLHGMAIKLGFDVNVYVGNALIDMYGKCGSLDDAEQVLEMMPERDNVSWNSLIAACCGNGMVDKALECFDKMVAFDGLTPNLVTWSTVIGGFAQNGYDDEAVKLLSRMQAEGLRPNARTLASVLPACARLESVELGREFHGYVLRHGFMANRFIVNGLVDVYRRCSDMASAFTIFDKYSVRNAVSYNTMIVGFCESGDVFKAKELFEQMQRMGIQRDIITWNSMISGLIDNFLYSEALSLFKDLMSSGEIEPDSFTLGSVLAACANMFDLRQGKETHSIAISRGLQSDTFVGGALVEMYCKCRDLVAAELAFDEVVEKEISTWNALISGYARSNETGKVRVLLRKMTDDGYEPNTYTWNSILAGHLENGEVDLVMQSLLEMQASNSCPDIYTLGIVLPACSRLATFGRGKQVHAHSIRRSYDSDVRIGAALVDMYSKCGSLKYAMIAYNRIRKPNLVCHNAMLTAYATHGYGPEGIALFQRVLATGSRPDEVTFLSALSSCVHAGSIETGYEFFDLITVYSLKPTLKHFTAMVDLLSRSGKLTDAYELIQTMPMKPDSVLWGALLGGCVVHCNVELGEIAANKLIELEPNQTGNYVLLANLYAYSRRWSDLARTRNMMNERGLQKIPGCSWIEDGDEIHVFVARDLSHTRTADIYDALDHLTLHMRTGFLVF